MLALFHTILARIRGFLRPGNAESDFDQEIAAGTRVATPDGTEFQTTAAVFLRAPSGGPGPAEVSAPVEAVRPGPEGNLEVDSITVVPSLQSQGIAVTNPAVADAVAGKELKVRFARTLFDWLAAH